MYCTVNGREDGEIAQEKYAGTADRAAFPVAIKIMPGI
jgi:hypothetical protein